MESSLKAPETELFIKRFGVQRCIHFHKRKILEAGLLKKFFHAASSNAMFPAWSDINGPQIIIFRCDDAKANYSLIAFGDKINPFEVLNFTLDFANFFFINRARPAFKNILVVGLSCFSQDGVPMALKNSAGVAFCRTFNNERHKFQSPTNLGYSRSRNLSDIPAAG
jgi:hypothetical protein